MFQIVLNQILIMFVMMLIGLICARTRLIDRKGNRVLSDMLLMLVSPCTIFTSFQIGKTDEVLKGLLLVMFFTVIVHVIAIVIGMLVFHGKDEGKRAINRFSIIYSNCGFIGIPLISSILGAKGVVLLSGYIAVFNIFAWTHGYVLMSGKHDIKELKKGLLSPTIGSIILGFIFFMLNIRVPSVIESALESIGGINTPLAMLVAGSTLAGTQLKEIVKSPQVYLVSLLKLVVVPACAIAVLLLAPVSKEVAYTVLVATACPTGATGVMLALKFDKGHYYASELFAATTVFCLATVPTMVLAAQMLGL